MRRATGTMAPMNKFNKAATRTTDYIVVLVSASMQAQQAEAEAEGFRNTVNEIYQDRISLVLKHPGGFVYKLP